VTADKKMVGLNIKRLVCENVVPVRGKDVLNHDSGLACAPLADDNRKAVLKRVCLQEISDIPPVVYPDKVLA
jgi:hypothetical protein